MDFKKLISYKTLAIIVLIICLLSIFSGSEWLLWRVSFLFGFQLGTIVSWIGLVACSFVTTKMNRNIQLMRILSSTSFYISIFWLLLSYILAGNNNLIFTELTHKELISWLSITSFPPLIFIISILYALFSKIIKLKKAKPD